MRRDPPVPVKEFSEPTEKLFRRCPADGIHEGTVHQSVFKHLCGLSVLRSADADPDDARWDSRIDCASRGKEPQVYPEQYVIEFPVSAATSPITADTNHESKPEHVPFADNYAHSEVQVYRHQPSPIKLMKSDSALNTEGKLRLAMLRTRLAEASTIALQPYEGSRYVSSGVAG